MARSKVPNPSQRVVEVPAGAEGAGGKKSRLEEPAAVILAGDILRWVIPKVGKFPKNVRYGLGARIESAHFDVLEELIRAQYARGGDRGRALRFVAGGVDRERSDSVWVVCDRADRSSAVSTGVPCAKPAARIAACPLREHICPIDS